MATKYKHLFHRDITNSHNQKYHLVSDNEKTVMVFNATFNIISVIAWQSVLLMEETRVPREIRRPVASH